MRAVEFMFAAVSRPFRAGARGFGGSQPTVLVMIVFWLFMGAAIRSLPLVDSAPRALQGHRVRRLALFEKAPGLDIFSGDAALGHAGVAELRSFST